MKIGKAIMDTFFGWDSHAKNRYSLIPEIIKPVFTKKEKEIMIQVFIDAIKKCSDKEVDVLITIHNKIINL